MEKYSGNQKGFIYASCAAKDQEVVFDKYLEPLARDGISFCWGDSFDGREDGFIAKSNAVMLFLTKDYAREEKLRRTVESAIKHDKPILSVYLEEVELDPGLSMQIESQQAMFVSRYKSDSDFVDDLKKAAIFDKIEVTEQQKKKQKRRVLIAVAAALVAVIALVAAIKPMLTPAEDTLGLGLSKKDLNSITELYIIGTEVMEANEEEYRSVELDNEKDHVRSWLVYHSGYENYYTNGEPKELTEDDIVVTYGEGNVVKKFITSRGELSDLTYIAQMKNLKLLQLDGQQIEDITPLFELKNLEQLSIACNPVSSFEGIEKLKNLQYLDIACTDISEETDLSVFNKMKSLRVIRINSGPEAVWLKAAVDGNIEISIEG